MDIIIRFVFGAVFGSFLNVIAVRYHPDHFLLTKKTIGGRSHCPHCGKTLAWYELVPFVSFLIQRGTCRACHARLSLQYPIIELLAGLVLAFVPMAVSSIYFLPNVWIAVLWVMAFFLLLLVSIIDLKWRIIPDELVILLGIIGLAITFLGNGFFGPVAGSTLGHYALLLGFYGMGWINRLIGIAFGFFFFFFLFVITRGRGMGFGDAKLAAAMGLLFGWPDIMLITMGAFIIGSLFAIPVVVLKKLAFKSTVPFGPFLAVSAVIFFLFGTQILNWYFGLL